MYIETVPNHGSRPTVLLREGWREGKKVCKRTLANLTDWPAHKIDTFRRLLKDETLVSPEEVFVIERSLPHGHVELLLEAIRRTGLDKLISAKRTRERDLVLAMIVEQLIQPCSKLATTRLWHSSTLAAELSLNDADEDELYGAMDWLLARQHRIENKLAKQHLSEGCQVLYDVSSSYYEGHTCPLVRFGHSRDNKRGKPIVVYGVLTDTQGRPLAVEVYPGNTSDPTTVPDQIDTLKKRFALERVILVGDRGMLTQTQIDELRRHPGMGWISALRSEKVRQLADQQYLQPSLFDERNLAQIHSPDFPGERLMACFNPLLAEQRKRKRTELLDAAEQALERISKEVKRRTRTPLSAAQIGTKVGKVINRFKMGKHFELCIADGQFSYARRTESIKREAELDGIYVVRTSEPEQHLSAEDAVRSYKNLAQVERVFRTFKGLDIHIRPIRHRKEERVRAHIFICLLAYYVEWQLRRVLAPLLFDDQTLPEDRKTRDPIAPAKPSPETIQKKTNRISADGLPIHSFETLLIEMGTRCRHRCHIKSDLQCPPIYQDTQPTALQTRVLELVQSLPVKGI